MANPWFRLYSEFSHDPKVQMMPEAMQRRYVMLMCLRCSNALETLQEAEIAFHLRIGDGELAETRALFVSKGFIDTEWRLLNWDKRQFASDSSTERVRKLRESRKRASREHETLQERSGNAPEQNRHRKDTDAEKKMSEKASLAPKDAELERVYKAYPKKVGRMKALEAIRKAIAHMKTGEHYRALATAEALEFLESKAARFAQSEAGQQGEYTPHPATWFNQGRYLDDEAEWDNVGQPRGASDGTGKGSANREAPAYTRKRQSDEALGGAFSKYRGDRPGGSIDVSDEGLLPRTGGDRRDCRDMGGAVAGDGRGVRGGGDATRAQGPHASITILPPSGRAKGVAGRAEAS